MSATVQNPVIARTALRAYPGWAVREYADGTFDSESGLSVSWICGSFRKAVAFARWQVRGGDMPDSLLQDGVDTLPANPRVRRNFR